MGNEQGFNTEHIETVEVPVVPASQSIEVKLSRWVFILGLASVILQSMQSSLLSFPWPGDSKLFVSSLCAILASASAAMGAANIFLLNQLKAGVVSKNVRVDSLPQTSKQS